MTTDRLVRLARLQLAHAQALEEAAKLLLRQCQRASRDLEALLRGWEREDGPDGPLFGGLPRPQVRDELAREGIDPDAAVERVKAKVEEAAGRPIPLKQPPRPAVTETAREWAVYRRNTTDRLGEVLATTEPSALARAIDNFGPDVWVCAAGAAQESATTSVPESATESVPDPAEPPAPDTPPPVSPAEPPGFPGQPVPHPSWAAPTAFTVALPAGQTVACAWSPASARGTAEGVLDMRGPVSPTGYRGCAVGAEARRRPLGEVAREWAQHYAEAEEARKLQGEAKEKQPDWTAARKEDLASGVAKPRKKRKPAKGAASTPAEPAGAEKEVAGGTQAGEGT